MHWYIDGKFDRQKSKRHCYSSLYKMAFQEEFGSRLRNLEIPRPSSCPPVGRAEPTQSPFLKDPRSEAYSFSLDGGPRKTPEIPFVINVDGPMEQTEVRNQQQRVQVDEFYTIPSRSASAHIPLAHGPQTEQQGWLSTFRYKIY